MAKGNIRSMRFSDQIVELIEAQVGDTFTAKFEALVTKCCWELPMKEQQLAEIQKQIDNERKNLRQIRERKQKLERYMLDMERSTAQTKHQMERILKDLETM